MRQPAIAGKQLQVPVFKFLREPLIRLYGENWYEQLCQAANLLRTHKKQQKKK